jgi:hypothetical protein
MVYQHKVFVRIGNGKQELVHSGVFSIKFIDTHYCEMPKALHRSQTNGKGQWVVWAIFGIARLVVLVILSWQQAMSLLREDLPHVYGLVAAL